MTTIIDIQQLTKSFGKFKALDRVDLAVEEGEIHGFIGPNGAGKTTTLRILLGMMKADAGQVKIFGKDAWREAVALHQRLAYVPAEANLWPNLTGGQVIDLLLKMRGQAIDAHKRDQLIQRFELDPTKKCRSYSKGNRQKVLLIAAFAAVDCDLYILDEPTSGLDPLMERLFQELVMEAKDQGKSILLSSHILSEVDRLCDSVSIIRQGAIIEQGSLKDLRHLRNKQVILTTERPLESLKQTEGVTDFVALVKNDGDETQAGHTYRLQVESHALSSVMSQMATYGILDIESQAPSLEDVFLHHYQSDQGGD